ncbi:ATP-binding protein [Rubrivirga sp. S365]|uniref:ATP-binding protein n=1 Tax=Rubrivirga sp. S365 TaxID=3076080 RepID=UPI0028C7125F|nr:ATP-binding protein [Rubrivirga sp. S365]MDT7858421.1 ATP-binding protein [Rubrivirga sp. S365]
MIPKPADVLDRDREWATLARAVDEPGPGLVLVVGRRRAGKSFLLTRFARATGGLYVQATRKTEREQLLDVSRALGERFDDAALRRVSLPDWEAVLDYVVERAEGEPFVFVLDEFPYLAHAAPALPSIIQAWWDHRAPETRVTLVLSGSHVSAMNRLVGADQPLYGRRTARVDVRPFDGVDAARFAPGWSARDKVRLYAVFGGLPGHLALVDPKRTLGENVARYVLDASGRLHDEAAHAFDSFLSDAAVHYSVVEAIASGERRWSRITSRVGKQTSALKRPLDWLLGMGVVERVAPITEYPRPNPKRIQYRLSDPYLSFWHWFVADIKGRGLASLVEPQALWEQAVAPRLDEAHVEGVFEDVCRQWVRRRALSDDGALARLPFAPMQVGSWWTGDSTEEVDVVAFDGKGSLLVGECKWGQADGRDLDTLFRRGALVAAEAGGIEHVTPVLFTAGGLDARAATRVEAGEAIHVPVETMFEMGYGAEPDAG